MVISLNCSKILFLIVRETLDSQIIFTYLEAMTDDYRDISLDYKLSGPKFSNLPTASNPAKFLPNVSPITGKDILIPKTSCSVFCSTNLNYILHNLHIESLVICGQITNQCVESAVRDAADLGYFVTLVEDACAAYNPEGHEKGLDGMSGFARIVKTDDVLQEIQNNSIHNSIDRKKELEDEVLQTQNDEKEECKITSNSSNNNDSMGDLTVDLKDVEEGESQMKDILQKYSASSLPSIHNGAISALLSTLELLGVKFLRIGTLDFCNSIRCKAIPLSSSFHNEERGEDHMDELVSIAECCFAGLPNYADVIIPKTNLSARRVLYIQPDFTSLKVLPYAKTHAMIFGFAKTPSNEASPYCTRSLLSKVLYWAKEEFGLSFSVGAEIEFQLFTQTNSHNYEAVDSSNFASTTTMNDQEHFINNLMQMLKEQSIEVELVHGESAPGQLEVVLKYQTDVLRIADSVVFAKETIKACAKMHSMRAVFTPKTNMMQAGNGLHLHFSFNDLNSSQPKRNAFPYAGNSLSTSSPSRKISAKGQSFMEGILTHLPALLAFSLPSINSFKRVGVGCWTGSTASWAFEDKESGLRVCTRPFTDEPCNLEYKLSDASANIYLEIAAILTGGLDGIQRKLHLRPPNDTDDTDDCDHVLPGSLEEALNCLRQDKLFENVLGAEVVSAYCSLKEAEVAYYKDYSLEQELKEDIDK